ncbi:MAG: Wzt carbohydrate-binding domain-containing protein [Desulfamplus sp.]|nr:Wzt carbohydrate-binding domain-containing protein [Desulfamplus sp.]
MQLKKKGTTMLLCSHHMFYVQSLCEQALWINKGEVMAYGKASSVIAEYETWQNSKKKAKTDFCPSKIAAEIKGSAKLIDISVSCDSITGHHLTAKSGYSTLEIKIYYYCDLELPIPTAAAAIKLDDDRVLTNSCSWIDGIFLKRSPNGFGVITLTYSNLPLLKGKYTLSVFLLCERGIFIYDFVERIVTLTVEQDNQMSGIVTIPHKWSSKEMD